MSTLYIIQTVFEIVMAIVIILGLIYEPILIKWEDKQKEKAFKAFKNRRKYRK